MVVPDQRKVPEIAGEMRINGGCTRAGTWPSGTIGSENTIRISFPSARLAISPWGLTLTIVSAAAGRGSVCATAVADVTTQTSSQHTVERTHIMMVSPGKKGTWRNMA